MPPLITTMIRTLLRRHRSPLLRRHHSAQAYPLTGFYLEILNNPLTAANPAPPRTPNSLPRTPPAPTPTAPIPAAVPKPAAAAPATAGDGNAESPGSAPEQRQISRGETVAGVYVPPKPEEPDNCCMSGCVTCVMTTFLEDLEAWRDAKKAAAAALSALDDKPAAAAAAADGHGDAASGTCALACPASRHAAAAQIAKLL